MQEDNESLILAWLSKGADIDSLSLHFDTPLCIAIKLNKLHTCELLLDHGANLHSSKNYSPLHLAVFGGLENVVELLLRRGAKLNESDKFGDSILHHAARGNRANMIPYLMIKGMDVNVVNSGGATPLDIAVKFKHLETVKVLIESRGILHDNNIIHEAASRNSLEIIDLLAPVLTPRIIHSRDKNGNTPMHLAYTEECVRKLAKLGYDIRAEDKRQWLPIHTAAALMHADLVKAFVEMDRGLLDYCATKTKAIKDDDGTPLYVAAYYNNIQSVRILLELGADMNFQGPNGSPLHIAIKLGFRALAQYLIEKGADLVTIHKQSGLAPLNLAISSYDPISNLIISTGIDINSTNSLKGRTPLHEAVISKHINMLGRLVELGADLEVESEKGTPLFLASMLGENDSVNVLLQLGARVDCEVQGWTPLHIAAYYGHERVVELLMGHERQGVHKNEEERMKYSPLDIAKYYGNDRVATIIKRSPIRFVIFFPFFYLLSFCLFFADCVECSPSRLEILCLNVLKRMPTFHQNLINYISLPIPPPGLTCFLISLLHVNLLIFFNI